MGKLQLQLGLAILFLCVTSFSVLSKDKPGMFVSYGVKTCSEMVLAHDKIGGEGTGSSSEIDVLKSGGPPLAWYFRGWILGFATAINSSIDGPPNFFKGMKSLDMIAWVVSWCRENQKQTVDTAIRRLATKVKP